MLAASCLFHLWVKAGSSALQPNRRLEPVRTLSLTRQKKEPRRFKDANRAMLLRDIGVHRFDVDLKHWTPERKGISA